MTTETQKTTEAVVHPYLTKEQLVAAVLEHAVAQIDEGWDEVALKWTPEQISKAFGRAWSVPGCIDRVAKAAQVEARKEQVKAEEQEESWLADEWLTDEDEEMEDWEVQSDEASLVNWVQSHGALELEV